MPAASLHCSLKFWYAFIFPSRCFAVSMPPNQNAPYSTGIDNLLKDMVRGWLSFLSGRMYPSTNQSIAHFLATFYLLLFLTICTWCQKTAITLPQSWPCWGKTALAARHCLKVSPVAPGLGFPRWRWTSCQLETLSSNGAVPDTPVATILLPVGSGWRIRLILSTSLYLRYWLQHPKDRLVSAGRICPWNSHLAFCKAIRVPPSACICKFLPAFANTCSVYRSCTQGPGFWHVISSRPCD